MGIPLSTNAEPVTVSELVGNVGRDDGRVFTPTETFDDREESGFEDSTGQGELSQPVLALTTAGEGMMSCFTRGTVLGRTVVSRPLPHEDLARLLASLCNANAS